MTIYNQYWIEDLTSPLVVNAMIVGCLVAVCAGIVGYFVVLNKLSFACHALSHIAMPGAVLAILIGIPMQFGIFTFAILGGSVITFADSDKKKLKKSINTESDVIIGIVLAFAVALGLLFASLTSSSTKTLQEVLFGSLLGVTSKEMILFSIGLCVIIFVTACFYRLLLWTAIDKNLAKAKGINVNFYSFLFVLMLSIVLAMSIQTVGALLIFSLLITPASSALRLTSKPSFAITFSIIFAIIAVVCGLVLATIFPFPPSFLIVLVSTTIWLVVIVLNKIRC